MAVAQADSIWVASQIVIVWYAILPVTYTEFLHRRRYGTSTRKSCVRLLQSYANFRQECLISIPIRLSRSGTLTQRQLPIWLRFQDV